MVRSAMAILALLVLPGVAQGQQRHQVVDGETLWTLAQRYYNDSWRWPRIYEANRDVIEDAHWIYPGEVLTIPDVAATAAVSDVTVQSAPAAAPAAPTAVRPAPTEPDRTVFFSTEVAEGFGDVGGGVSRTAVSRDVSVSAPWLGPIQGPPANIGSVTELSGADDERVPRGTALPYDRVEVRLPGLAPQRGTELLAFRVAGTVPGVGQVLVPTGVLAVSDPTPEGAIALVVTVFDRLQPGDLLQLAPSFSLRPGAMAQPVSSSADATILGFAREHALQSVSDIVFLDQGSDHGVAIGDEYVVRWEEGAGVPSELEGRLQVIAVRPDHASARIVWLRNPVFTSGLRVGLDRKMP